MSSGDRWQGLDAQDLHEATRILKGSIEGSSIKEGLENGSITTRKGAMMQIFGNAMRRADGETGAKPTERLEQLRCRPDEWLGHLGKTSIETLERIAWEKTTSWEKGFFAMSGSFHNGLRSEYRNGKKAQRKRKEEETEQEKEVTVRALWRAPLAETAMGREEPMHSAIAETVLERKNLVNGGAEEVLDTLTGEIRYGVALAENGTVDLYGKKEKELLAVSGRTEGGGSWFLISAAEASLKRGSNQPDDRLRAQRSREEAEVHYFEVGPDVEATLELETEGGVIILRTKVLKKNMDYWDKCANSDDISQEAASLYRIPTPLDKGMERGADSPYGRHPTESGHKFYYTPFSNITMTERRSTKHVDPESMAFHATEDGSDIPTSLERAVMRAAGVEDGINSRAKAEGMFLGTVRED